jgi:hypothetical protein
MVIRLPVTPEGRQALRNFIPFIGDGGPYPDGSYIEDADWDEVAKDIEDIERFLAERGQS